MTSVLRLLAEVLVLLCSPVQQVRLAVTPDSSEGRGCRRITYKIQSDASTSSFCAHGAATMSFLQAIQKAATQEMIENAIGNAIGNVDGEKLTDAASEERSDHICVRATESCFFRAQSQIILLYLSFG